MRLRIVRTVVLVFIALPMLLVVPVMACFAFRAKLEVSNTDNDNENTDDDDELDLSAVRDRTKLRLGGDDIDKRLFCPDERVTSWRPCERRPGSTRRPSSGPMRVRLSDPA